MRRLPCFQDGRLRRRVARHRFACFDTSVTGGFDLPNRDASRRARSLCLAIATLALAGCAGQAQPPGGTADSSGYLGAGTRSSIVVANKNYDRAIECGGAIARLHKDGAVTGVDTQEIEALGAAWMANAVELGARRRLSDKQVIAAAGAAGGQMSAEQAAEIWGGCKSGK